MKMSSEAIEALSKDELSEALQERGVDVSLSVSSLSVSAQGHRSTLLQI